jgi:hypothetical protein
MAASFRPGWVWPLLALPPAAVGLRLIEAPAEHWSQIRDSGGDQRP